MGLFWFLIFFTQLAISSSLAELKDNGLTNKQEGMQFKIHHVYDLESFGTPASKSLFLDMLEKDEERVRDLRSILSNALDSSKLDASASFQKVEGPELVSIPLKSGLSLGSGNYYVKVGLGTPPKYFTMVVDTGSSLSWLQCEPCAIYCHSQIDPIFNPSNSKTYKTLPCASSLCSSLKGATLNDPACAIPPGACVYRASYGDSSFSVGYLSQDVLALTPSETLAGFVYGCGQNNYGLFGRSAGILGLGNNRLSVIAQLSSKYGYGFSYCLPTSFAATNPSIGGFLNIGSSSLSKSPYKYTPMVKNPKVPSLYLLDLTAITVAGKPLAVAASSYKVPTIIDSGTVITRLPTAVSTALKSAFVNIMSKKYARAPGASILDTCFRGRAKDMSAAPEIQMIFGGGADLTLNAHNTLLEIENGTTCLAFAGSSSEDSIAIIGNFQQQTFNVAYDISNSRIGFAPGGCQ